MITVAMHRSYQIIRAILTSTNITSAAIHSDQDISIGKKINLIQWIASSSRGLG